MAAGFFTANTGLWFPQNIKKTERSDEKHEKYNRSTIAETAAKGPKTF